MKHPHDIEVHRCPWCLRAFATRDGVRCHMRATRHDQFVGDSEERRLVKLARQRWHEDNLARKLARRGGVG